MNFFVCIKLPNSSIYAIKLRWKGWGGGGGGRGGVISGMSCISCKEIAFLTIINLKNANFYGAAPLDSVWVGGLQHHPPPPATPQLLLPRFAPFALLAWASSLHSEGLPRFLLISVLMPALAIKTHPST